MGSPSRNVQYHPPRLSEDRLNLAPASQSIFAYTLPPGNRECARLKVAQGPAEAQRDRLGRPRNRGDRMDSHRVGVDRVREHPRITGRVGRRLGRLRDHVAPSGAAIG